MSDLTHKIIADLRKQLDDAIIDHVTATNQIAKLRGALSDAIERAEVAEYDLHEQRARAEGAEQELRESNRQREIEKRVLWSTWEWFDDHDDRKTSAEIHHELQHLVGEWHGRVVEDSGLAHYGAAGLAAKLAAARAHIAGVDVAKLETQPALTVMIHWKAIAAAAREVLS